MRRALPLPTGPLASPVVAPAAIVLPGPGLSHLAPGARATFAKVVRCLVAGRPVPVTRFVTQDFELAAAELESVLAWVR